MARINYTEIKGTIRKLSALRQLVATAEAKVSRMTIARTKEGLGKLADEAAREIENTFARGGMDRDQRLLNITKTIRRQLATLCQGEAFWDD